MVWACGCIESARLVVRSAEDVVHRARRGAHRICLERETMAYEANTNIPERLQPTRADERINPVPSDEQRMEREANKLAHKGRRTRARVRPSAEAVYQLENRAARRSGQEGYPPARRLELDHK